VVVELTVKPLTLIWHPLLVAAAQAVVVAALQASALTAAAGGDFVRESGLFEIG
jgi:C4-dicarboxylate transporter